jgi:hypothetical protein
LWQGCDEHKKTIFLPFYNTTLEEPGCKDAPQYFVEQLNVFKMRLCVVGLCLAALAIGVSGAEDPTASLAGVADLT